MGFNAKLFEVVLYADSSNFDGLTGYVLNRSGLRDFAYIIHDQDEGKKHCHFMLRMNDTRNSDNIAKWFDVKSNQVERCKGRWSDMLAYLTHSNASEKFQYDPIAVTSNFDWKKEADKASNKGNKRLEDIVDGIAKGEIRRFNYSQFVNPHEWVKYKSKMNSAFEYRNQIIKGVDRDMKSIYIYGGSGTGKTTFAKQIANDKGYSIFISSGSNDVLDGYEGQDCIILDDLRPSCLGLSDLLKMLDPRTASSVKSRYYNKTLECKLIVITTTKSMDTFFQQVFDNEDEPLKQLQRRCMTKIKMTKDNIYLSMYDQNSGRYVSDDPISNIVLEDIQLSQVTAENMSERSEELFKSYDGYQDAVKRKNEKKLKKNNNDPLVNDAITMFNGEKLKIPF